MTQKIKLIHEYGVKIENALIIVCSDATFVPKTLTVKHLIVKHPLLSGQPIIQFQAFFLKTYLSNGFFVRYLDYQLFNKLRHYMYGYIQESQINVDSVTNDLFVPKESEIMKDSITYYHNIPYEFKQQHPYPHKYTPELITVQHLWEMLEIRHIFDQDCRKYKIVISPLYDQVYFNRIDLYKIRSIFGTSNVFDFSGVNDITSNKFNYYERSHYRYRFGRNIMEQVYSKSE